MSDVKQVIILRTDLNMRKGKMIAQGAHASMAVLLGHRLPGVYERPGYFTLVPTEDMMTWLGGTFTKIVVGVESEEAFHALLAAAKVADLPCAAIQDNGFTEFKGVPTWTALAVGPAKSVDIDKITGHLKLL